MTALKKWTDDEIEAFNKERYLHNLDLEYERLQREKRFICQQRGRSSDWKSPFEWTDKEVHDLVISEVGADIVFATGFSVLLKLWVPNEKEGDVYMPDILRRNDSSVVGKIIGMGADAFMDTARFPSGPTHTYGEWCMFRPYEDQKFRIVGSHLLTKINDERVGLLTNDPDNVQSFLRLEEEYKGVGG